MVLIERIVHHHIERAAHVYCFQVWTVREQPLSPIEVRIAQTRQGERSQSRVCEGRVAQAHDGRWLLEGHRLQLGSATEG
jgi:hypothetical protein